MRIMDITRNTVFRPSDFSNSVYNGMAVFNRADRMPVVVLMSKSCNPPHWMVMDGFKQMFYLTYGEAMDYCKRRGYTSAVR